MPLIAQFDSHRHRFAAANAQGVHTKPGFALFHGADQRN